MKRFTLFVSLLLAVVIVVFIGFSRLTDVVASHLSEKLGVSVSIDAIGLRTDEFKIKQIQIANPSGYSLPKAFWASQILVKAFPVHLLKHDLEIEEIDINDVVLGLEFDSATSTKGNWTVIMQNFKDSLRKEESEENPDGRTILLKRLVVTNVSTQLLFHGGGSVQTLPTIGRMEFTNITVHGGVPKDQLIASILGQMLIEIFKEHHLNNMIGDIFLEPIKIPEQAAETIIKPFEKLFP